MERDRWKEVERLFEAALDRPADERTAWLRAACGDDPPLYREVATMLEAHEQAGAFLEQPVLKVAPDLWPAAEGDAPDTLPAGRRIGPYRLLKMLGRGGMGAVYLAERTDGPIERQVALKVLRPGFERGGLVRRFMQEQRVLSALEHPGIARLYDAGTTDDGTPYFAMEYVHGRPIDRYCDDEQLSVEARLRLFMRAGEAVQHAHRNLIVHRDLKPSNVLVKEEGEEGEHPGSGSAAGVGSPLLLDFGIAKLIAEGAEAAAPITRTGERWMTPEYAAPEQVRGEAVSTATDVYALGALLYKLLTGGPPFQLEGCTTSEIERVICEEPPIRPGAAVTAPPDDREPDRLRRKLRGDLDTIILKALRKEPERRYASAEAFVEDIRRHLAGLPVKARRDTLGYRTRKFAHRHRWGVGVTAAIMLLIAGFAAFYTMQITQERDRARTEAAKATEVSDFLVALFEASDPMRRDGAALTAKALLQRGVERIERDLDGQPDVQAAMLVAMGNAYRGLGQYDSSGVLLRRALALRRRLPGDHRPEVAASLEALAELHADRNARAAADSLYRMALALRRMLPDRTALAEALTGRAGVLSKLGRYGEAEALLRETLAIQQEVYGKASLKAAGTMWHLSFVFYAAGRYSAAEALMRQVLAIRRSKIEAPHRLIASTLDNLGTILHQQAYRAEASDQAAERLVRQALKMRRALGPDHPTVASSLIHLATFLQKPAQKEVLLREALHIQESHYGPNHRRLSNTFDLLVSAKHELGQLDSAVVLQRRVVRMHRNASTGPNMPLVARLAYLGNLLRADGRMEEACAPYREVFDMTRQLHRNSVMKVSPAQRARGTIGWGLCLLSRENYAEAEPLLVETLALLEGSQRRYARETTRLAIEHLTQLYDAWGKPDEAARYRTLLAESGGR